MWSSTTQRRLPSPGQVHLVASGGWEAGGQHLQLGPPLEATSLCVGSWGCWKKLPHPWWLRTQMYSLGVLGFGRPKSASLGYGQGVSRADSFWRFQIPCVCHFQEVPAFLGGWPLSCPPQPLLCGHTSMTLTVLGPGLPFLPALSSAFHFMAF